MITRCYQGKGNVILRNNFKWKFPLNPIPFFLPPFLPSSLSVTLKNNFYSIFRYLQMELIGIKLRTTIPGTVGYNFEKSSYSLINTSKSISPILTWCFKIRISIIIILLLSHFLSFGIWITKTKENFLYIKSWNVSSRINKLEGILMLEGDLHQILRIFYKIFFV